MARRLPCEWLRRSGGRARLSRQLAALLRDAVCVDDSLLPYVIIRVEF